MYRLPTTATAPFCPSEVEGTIRVPPGARGARRFFAFAGTGLLISIGYMDPGNWATDLEAGSRFGYALLPVVLFASAAAALLQTLCVRLGIVTGRDLAQHSSETPRPWRLAQWAAAEAAIVACDFAEVLGTALALKLLFSLPLAIGIGLTALDTVLVLALQGAGFRRLEAIVAGFVAVIAAAYAIELALVRPSLAEIFRGAATGGAVFHGREAWVVAVGILGATVMPHNLYLHSSIVKTRSPEGVSREEAVRYTTWDTALSLGAAFFVNAAILVLAGAAFHGTGHTAVATIEDAHRLLAPLLGTGAASVVFAIALFAAGQSSTLTGTVAGQVVMEGFLKLWIPCWQRRLITRSLALVPAWIGIALLGDGAVGKLLVWSQVALSLQLPFAVIPLVRFTSDRARMGRFVNPRWLAGLSWALCAAIVAANVWLVRELVA